MVPEELHAPGGKTRLDAYLAAKLPQASRARLQASIKEGLVAVNGRPQGKSSYGVRLGDAITCSVLPPPPLEAAPEDLPLDIVFEDEHVLVVNKDASMVMHPSPGHYTGTLVNALLHHCGLGPMRVDPGDAAPLSLAASPDAGDDQDEHDADADADLEVDFDEEDAAALVLRPAAAASSSASYLGPTIRPGIVHRLDKGTTGLVVVAKTDAAHASLSRQFRDRTVERAYVGVTLRTPRPPSGRVATNVGRDFRDRKKMAAFAYDGGRGRTAASNYALVEALGGGRAAVVRWRLETGRTHQIRVHAKHLGHPLLGDDAYGGGAAAAVAAMAGGRPAAIALVQRVVRDLGRPALHAQSLGFEHPVSGERLRFEAEMPRDLRAAVEALREGFQ